MFKKLWRGFIGTLGCLVRCAGRLLWAFVPFAKCPKCQRWTWWERHLWKDGLFWSGWRGEHDTPNTEGEA